MTSDADGYRGMAIAAYAGSLHGRRLLAGLVGRRATAHHPGGRARRPDVAVRLHTGQLPDPADVRRMPHAAAGPPRRGGGRRMMRVAVVGMGVIAPAFLGADDYRAVCELLDLAPVADGYGIVHMFTEDGAPMSAVTSLGLAGGMTRLTHGWVPLPAPGEPS